MTDDDYDDTGFTGHAPPPALQRLLMHPETLTRDEYEALHETFFGTPGDYDEDTKGDDG
jgi:hypothetical protein